MLGRRSKVSDFKIEQSISKTNREVKARDINQNITCKMYLIEETTNTSKLFNKFRHSLGLATYRVKGTLNTEFPSNQS